MSQNKKNSGLLSSFMSIPKEKEKGQSLKAISFRLPQEDIDSITEYVDKKVQEVGRKNYSSSHFIREAIAAYLNK